MQVSNSLVDSASVHSQGVGGCKWLEAGRELMAVLLLQKEDRDKMMSEALWTGRKQELGSSGEK